MTYTFKDHWITETLRLREALWGPLEDSAEVGRARAQGGNFTNRLLTRSRLLGEREGVTDGLHRWQQIARMVLVLFCVIAVIAGGSVAAGALGDGGRPVNLTLAVAALLGLNTLTFLFWATSFAVQPGVTSSLLTDAWLKLTRKLARGPDAALLPRALLELMTRSQLSRWGAGVLSHGLWALGLLGAFITLLALLAARRYTFQWETTVLSPETFVMLVKGLGWLPSLIGFPQPSADMIRASGANQALSDSAQALWSAWLLGVVLVYGIVPRLIALGLSVTVMRRRLAGLTIDPTLPGLAELQDRLMPASETTGIDSPAGRPYVAPSPPQAGEHSKQRSLVIVGLELPSDLPWPPVELPPELHDLGVIDTREERNRVLEQLRHEPARRVVVCCDARQTPDRGTLALLAELASLTSEIRFALLPDDDTPARRSLWHEQLMRLTLLREQPATRLSPALEWLMEGTHPEDDVPRVVATPDTRSAPDHESHHGDPSP